MVHYDYCCCCCCYGIFEAEVLSSIKVLAGTQCQPMFHLGYLLAESGNSPSGLFYHINGSQPEH